jgi:hypothetical protein
MGGRKGLSGYYNQGILPSLNTSRFNFDGCDGGRSSGHQSFDEHTDTPRLGLLSSYVLWSMIETATPAHVNLFSCNSERMAAEVKQL